MTHHSAPTRGEVTQGDREAAAVLTDFLHSGEAPKAVARIRDGSLDHTRIVQAFAAHRLATIEECAKIAEDDTDRNYSTYPVRTVVRMSIAQRIRNLGRGV